MLVGAGEEHHIKAHEPFIAGDGVGRDGAVGMAYVQLIGRVVDGCGDIEFFLFHALFSYIVCAAGQPARYNCSSASM